MKILPTQKTLTEQVHEAIVAAIIEGKLRPGERIIQEQIADALGVSRQPVQQALLLLRNQGLLREASGRGLIVTPLDLDQVRHIYEVRSVVEGLAFRKAAALNSVRARQLGPTLIQKGRDAVRSGSVAAMVNADMELHGFVCDLSDNPVIGPTLAAQWTYTQRVMGELLMREEAPLHIWDQHERMLDAVMAADPDAAERLARDHIMESAAFIIGRMRSERDAVPSALVRSPKPKAALSSSSDGGDHPTAAALLSRAWAAPAID